MTSRKPSLSELERDRRRRADELIAESGDAWADSYLPGTAGCHELLDRTSLLSDQLERRILDHPACVANPEWFRLAEQAAAALRALYQLVGAEHLGSAAPSGQEADDVPA